MRLEDVYLANVTSAVPGGRIDPLYNVLAFHTTHVACVNFVDKWPDLQSLVFNFGTCSMFSTITASLRRSLRAVILKLIYPHFHLANCYYCSEM